MWASGNTSKRDQEGGTEEVEARMVGWDYMGEGRTRILEWECDFGRVEVEVGLC